MVQAPDEAARIIVRYDGKPDEGMAWATSHLGIDREAAYIVPKCQFKRPGSFAYNAVGGVDLPLLPQSMQAEVADGLREADYVSVRDAATQRALASLGIQAALAPNPAVLVAELFGERIVAHSERNDVTQASGVFQAGYIAFQCSADFADDATLDALAEQLDQVMRETRLESSSSAPAPLHGTTAWSFTAGWRQGFPKGARAFSNP
jgi:hypothetical protein